MNAVEIEESVSELVAEAFQPAEFPILFLAVAGGENGHEIVERRIIGSFGLYDAVQVAGAVRLKLRRIRCRRP